MDRPGEPIDEFGGMNRREFFKLAAGVGAGAMILGALPNRALAEVSALGKELREAGSEYGIPHQLLKAMAYVNTQWEMPPPEDCVYRPRDLHHRGEYGIMQLAQNPSRNTLATAAELTGIDEERLKSDRVANIRGGAALLASLAGQDKPEGLDAWRGVVEEYGGIDLYANEVYDVLQRGATLTISTGETVSLVPQNVEVPVVFEAMGKNTAYGRARWMGAARSNYTSSRREKSYNISKIVIHVVEGSAAAAVRTFKDPNMNVSAHYVIAADGRVIQCVRHRNIAWHCGDWYYNCRSIGIEHAGWGRYKKTWRRRKMKASARLSAYLCRRHNISLKRKNFLKHRELSSTQCPGPHFSMKRYFRFVRRYL